ncbi:MAG: hypothetical protein ACOCWG_06215 [bacterium]
MITLQEVMELGKFKITGSEQFLWTCYGYDARIIDFSFNEHDLYAREVKQDAELSVIFDTKTQTVYEVYVHDYVKENYYKMVNPDYFDKLVKYSQEHQKNYKIVFEDEEYTFLETNDDFITKASAIINNEPYDERIAVPLELSDEEFMRLAMLAHKNDMSINEFVEKNIEKMINKYK